MQDRVASVLLLGQLPQAGDHTQCRIAHWKQNQHLQGMQTKLCDLSTAGQCDLQQLRMSSACCHICMDTTSAPAGTEIMLQQVATMQRHM